MYKSGNNSSYGGARPKTQVKILTADNSDTTVIEQGEDDAKPLEQKEILTFVNGRQVRKKALHPDWVEQKVFMDCSHPHFLGDDMTTLPGGSESWIDEISFFCSDLEWLLSLPHYKFWSQIIYDSSIHTCLDSFLSSRLRWFDTLAYSNDMQKAAERADQLVFLVYLRMATYKESKTEHISPDVFGDLIYNNFIFDCCKLLDLCVLYGNSNTKLLSKMVQNVFSNQPKYNDDLKMMISSLKSALSNMETELGIFPDKIPISQKKLADVISFMADNLFSVFSFLSVYPEASSVFHKEHYIERLASFYQAAIPFISENLSCHSKKGVNVESLMDRLKMGRIAALSVFKEIIYNLCLLPLQTVSLSTQSLDECITMYITIVTAGAEERIFITDYDAMFGFEDGLILFEGLGADITTLDYIKETVSRSVAETHAQYGAAVEISKSTTTKPQTESSNQIGNDTSGMNGYYLANQQEMSEVEIASLVHNIQDLLPDLGTGFVKECLKYYSYSVEDVLNGIFECNLPPSLDSLDRRMPDEPSPNKNVPNPADIPTTKKDSEKSILEDRGNVYNGDEFDTFSSKETLKKVRTGKKPLTLKAPDKELVAKLKEIGREYEINAGYSIYEDELKYTPMHATDYDDEFDDTYEGGYISRGRQPIGRSGVASIFGKGALNVKGIDFDATPSGSDNETNDTAAAVPVSTTQPLKKPNKRGPFNNKKPSTNNNTHRGDNRNSYQNPSQTSVPKDQATVPVVNTENIKRTSQPQDFCENPEDVRKRAEDRRRVKMQNRGFVPRKTHAVGEQRHQMPERRPEGQQQQPLLDRPPEGRPKVETKNNDKANKNDEEAGRSIGGKQKKETGDKKDNAYRKKTIHKNEHKRFGAQAKQRGRF